MAHKFISKTDVGKNAIVVVKSLRDVLDNHGRRKLRGDEVFTTDVRIHLTNLNKRIQMHYYASERKGAGRRPEPRCWHSTFGELIRVGSRFTIIEHNGRLQLTIS